MQTFKFDNTWSLFLDRDGVINRKLDNDFVTSLEEFEYFPNTESTIVKLSNFFKYTFVVTNQRCIDEGLLLERDLKKIHNQLVKDIEYLGGKIDKIYYCPHLKELKCECRKPGTLMAQWAKQDFPDVNFVKSIIIGDSLTDLQFGKSLGMKTVYIKQKNSMPEAGNLADYIFKNIYEFSTLIE